MLKQAMNTVESKLDKALDMSENNSYQGDVYVDPITGFVTTIDPPARPKSPNISNNNISASPTSTPNKPSPKLGPRSNSSDLIESLKSKSSDLLANIRIQTGSPRSSLQGESPRSSLHKTSLESDSEVPNNSSSKNSTLEPNLNNTKDNTRESNNSVSVPNENQDNNENKVDTPVINGISDFSSTNESSQNESETIKDGHSINSLIPVSSESVTDKQKEESDTSSKINGNNVENNGIKVFEESTNEESQENDVIDNQKSSIIESPETSKNFQLIIEQRERQLTSAIEQNALLNDTVEKFKLQLKELEENKNDELKIARNHVEGLENQLKGANKELNMFRQQEASKESSSIQNLLEMQRKLLLEKDEQISGLMSEGEKLSKSELEYRTNLKKYRAKDIEQENRLADLQKKYDKATSEIAELSSNLKQLREIEKKNSYDLKSLENEKEKKTQKNLKLEIDVAVAKEEREKLQRLLDQTNEELKRTLEINATLSSQAQTAALEKEIQINERLHHELEQLRTESENTENSLRTEIRELRATLARIEEQAGLREDNLRHEISTLQKRLQIAEAAAQDVTSGERDVEHIQILRQIEDVQTQHALSMKNWEKIENSLSKQLTEMEMERDHFADKFENLNNQFKEMSLTAEQQELQLIDKHNQNIKLNEEIKSLRARIPNLEAKIEDLVSELESSKETHKIALQEAEEQYRCALRQALEEKQEELEQKLHSEQKNKLIKEHEQEKRQIKLESIKRNFLKSASETQLGSLKSASETHLEKHYDGALSSPVVYSPTSSARSSVDGSSSMISCVMMVEKLNSSVRHLEGQVGALQAQLQMTTKNRDELADELVKLTVQMEDYSTKAEKLSVLEQQLYELNERYHITLELLGEKTEQVDELQADIKDMKDVYRNQITELAAELEKHKNAS
ncbi:TATA element modulatory factor [Rhizophagus irregularis DAOM 181602=DAOM 197198]|nr:TATA element modulatory factor [Rhizophagus irregularis DAOM 181602=DAOM 197198]CAG8695156.1 14093_t:CDS:10 [Rhizophagus irregularis]